MSKVLPPPIAISLKTADIKNLSPFDRLCYWITERERIRRKKEAGEPKPWTEDLILRNYRFCNVRRMDDKVSIWLYDHWYEPYFDHPNMLVACCLARHFNKPSTLVKITNLVLGKNYQPEVIKRVLQEAKKKGETIYNGAYMIRADSGVEKIEATVDIVTQPLYDKPPHLTPSSMQACHTALMSYHGLGSFMAGQIVADLRWAKEGTWLDKDGWAPIGPGSKRGMNRLFGCSIKAPMSDESFLLDLRHLRDDLEKASQDNLRLKGILSRIELMDLQNCLCEYDKYNRALFGEGKPKQKYPGV